ncbi:hypothetical protein SAMN05444506_11483 [Pseudomonas syringae]|uniref:Integrase n=1 Tax=Pseudomonas syringae pv. apii TaxID=81036 RepID=A0A3M3MYW1_9PSED|nr:Integrase [Pseudomonas syringae pv. apii]RMN52694.1 Integrase [Pseudomonas syringae pv. apii]RMN95944.1 Integrase [Pseudomonas syringae pv. apii]SDZ30820.1 hypothetical protein SAMN05444506_11483 [Pseudomonas syringae]
MFGGGHYGTVKAHCDRWLAFVKWYRSEQGPGINDARPIDLKVLADYRCISILREGLLTCIPLLLLMLRVSGCWRS